MHAAIGTVPYMAPRAAARRRGASTRRPTSTRSPQISIARSLARCPSTPARACAEKLQQEARPLETGRQDAAGKSFERIVGKALRRRPAERFANAREMLDELTALVTAAPELP